MGSCLRSTPADLTMPSPSLCRTTLLNGSRSLDVVTRCLLADRTANAKTDLRLRITYNPPEWEVLRVWSEWGVLVKMPRTLYPMNPPQNHLPMPDLKPFEGWKAQQGLRPDEPTACVLATETGLGAISATCNVRRHPGYRLGPLRADCPDIRKPLRWSGYGHLNEPPEYAPVWTSRVGR